MVTRSITACRLTMPRPKRCASRRRWIPARQLREEIQTPLVRREPVRELQKRSGVIHASDRRRNSRLQHETKPLQLSRYPVGVFERRKGFPAFRGCLSRRRCSLEVGLVRLRPDADTSQGGLSFVKRARTSPIFRVLSEGDPGGLSQFQPEFTDGHQLLVADQVEHCESP